VSAGDDIKFTASGSNQAIVSLPPDAPANVSIMTRVLIEQTTGNNDADVGVSAIYNPSNDTGIRCELYSPTATQTANRIISAWDSIKKVELGNQQFAWVTGTPYSLSMDRAGTNYVCRTSASGGTPASANGNSTSAPAQQKFVLRAYAATVSFSYVLIVTNP
jgi:hypothetical protein